MSCIVTYKDKEQRFIARVDFRNREIPKRAKFRWCPVSKTWYTESLAVAVRLREYFDDLARSRLKGSLIDSTPWSGRPPLAPEGLLAKPFQLEAAQTALSSTPFYYGADPGLGKTIVAALVAECFGGNVIYICPPFLVSNVQAEFQKWAPSLITEIYQHPISKRHAELMQANVVIIPDSLLTRDHVRVFLQNFQGHLLIADEAHRFKNFSAQRTKALFSYTSLFERHLLMSGTPMPNRPLELYSILSHFAPETIDFMSEHDFAVKYCGAYETEFGWDYNGGSEEDTKALARRVVMPSGPFMLRHKKKLLNLPPKITEMFTVSHDMSASLKKLNHTIKEAYGTHDDAMKQLIARAQNVSEDELHLGTYRRMLGLEMVAPAAEFIKNVIEESGEAVLVFAYHKEVIATLREELKEFLPFVITGETPVDDRQKIVNRFQKDKDKLLFIGNYIAAGIGFTITKATRVIFVEFSWTPADNEQASDRAHRIGQTGSVLVQYLVFKDSMHQLMLDTVLRKSRAIQHV